MTLVDPATPPSAFTSYNATTGVDVGLLAPGDSATVMLHAHALSTDRNGPFNVAQGFAVSVPLPTTDPTPRTTRAALPRSRSTPSPRRPQNVQAVPGNTNAIITWQQPANLGGPTRTIIDYSVTVTPTVGGSPFTVSAGPQGCLSEPDSTMLPAERFRPGRPNPHYHLLPSRPGTRSDRAIRPARA